MIPSLLARFLVIAPLIAVAIAGCSMVSSSLLETDSVQPGADCSSSGGAYSLSRSYLAFEVHRNDPSNTEEARRHPFVLKLPAPPSTPSDTQYDSRSGVLVQVKPDPSTIYCLDYLRAMTSNDTFNVGMTNHLLDTITTTADDKSKEIAQNLVQALFVGLSGNPDLDTNNPLFRAGAPSLGGTLQFTGTFDPFDHEQVNQVNAAINRYGFCMFVEGEPINPRFDNVDAYCEHPLRWRASGPQIVPGSGSLKDGNIVPASAGGNGAYASEAGSDLQRAGRDVLPPRYSRGIFYRPRLPHTVYLYVKENLKLKDVRGAWKMRGSSTVLLENASPVFSVAVDRTFFAKRETILAFDSGSLRDITVKKSSELANFVTIPLQIAKGIVALPSAVIMIKVDQDNARGQLIDAQNNLILAQRQLAADKAADVPDAAPKASTRSGGERSGQFSPIAGNIGLGQCVEQCVAESGNASSCQNFCSCKVAVCRLGDGDACSRACKLE